MDTQTVNVETDNILNGARQDITLTKEEEKRMAKAIIVAIEQERRYIGGELHDNINQLLAGSLLTLGMIKELLRDNSKAVKLIDLVKGYTLNALTEIRKLSHELAPACFEDITLKASFEDLISGINLNGQFNIDLHFDESFNNSMRTEIQITLYRILQEQVKNILKYSEADTIEISVTTTENAVTMRTFDNGRGFDTGKAKKGIGLSNMKKRVESFAGKFSLHSKPGKGCEIIVEIPTGKSAL